MLKIFTEGRDEIFIKKYLIFLGYEEGVHFTTDSNHGWDTIHLVAPKLRELSDDTDNKVVLIYDADSDINGGGYINRRQSIEQKLQDEGLDLEFFLFPNNEDDGDFESLLIKIACKERGKLFNCFDGYEACVKGLETNELKFKLPLKKARIFAYIESFNESNTLKEKEIKNRTFFFDNSVYWKLDSEHLENLKTFLESFIK